MDDFWGALGALATIVLPIVLAGWLLGRSERRRRRPPKDPHGKMTDKEQG